MLKFVCMEYGFSLGAFGIIFNKKREVLLCHRRDYDLWNLPGGGILRGESPWEAVIREIREETRLDTKILRLSGIYNKPTKNEVVFSFVCSIESGRFKPTAEADEIKYFSLSNLPSNTVPKQV